MSQIVRSIDLGVQARQRRQELHLKKQLAEIELQKQGYEVTDGKITGGPQHSINQQKWNLERQAYTGIQQEADANTERVMALEQENNELKGRTAKIEADDIVSAFAKGEATAKDVSNVFMNNPYLKKIMNDGGIDKFQAIDFKNDTKLLKDNDFFEKFDADGNGELSDKEIEAIDGLYVKALGTDGKEYIKSVEGFLAMMGTTERVPASTAKLIMDRLGRLNNALRGGNVEATDRKLDLQEGKMIADASKPKEVKKSRNMIDKEEKDKNLELVLGADPKSDKFDDAFLDRVAKGEVSLDNVNLPTDVVNKEDKKELDAVVAKMPAGTQVITKDLVTLEAGTGLVNFAKRVFKKHIGGMDEAELEGLMVESAFQTMVNTDIKYHAGAQTSPHETARMRKAYGTNLVQAEAFAAYNANYWKRTYQQFKDKLQTTGRKGATLKRYSDKLQDLYQLYKSAEAQYNIQKLMLDNEKKIIKGTKKNPKVDYVALDELYGEKFATKDEDGKIIKKGDMLEDFPLIGEFLSKEDRKKVMQARGVLEKDKVTDSDIF